MCTVWYLVGISLLIWLKPPDMSWSSDLFWSLCWFQFPRHLPNWMIWHLIWSWKRRWKYRIDLKNSGWVIYNLSWLLPHSEWPIFHKHPGWWGVFGNDFPNIWFVCKAFSGWNLKITFFGKENHLIPKPSYSKPPFFEWFHLSFQQIRCSFLRWKRFLCGHQLNWKAYQDSQRGWYFFEPWTVKRETTRSKDLVLLRKLVE